MAKYWDDKLCNIVNKQIDLEYKASYSYHALFSYFDRDNVGLKNIAKFFNKCSLEEREHAHNFMEYQNKRGGNVSFTGIKTPVININNTNYDVLEAFKIAYSLEEEVYNHLLKLHKLGDKCNDPQFCDYIESEFLEEQINAMNEIKVYISQLERIGDDGHGVWDFDRNFECE